MKCAGIGYEAGLDLNFYPFFWSQGAASGLGFFVDALYQYRPLENMGKLTDISGWGFRLGIEYRWDFGRPTARPTTVPPPEPTPSPVPEAPPPPPPPPR